jgi:Mn2+/Fe2+ NRAMP family transporter
MTVVDGFPRALAGLARVARGEEPAVVPGERERLGPAYWLSVLVLGAGSLAIIAFFADQLRPLVDLATTLSFLTAPALAWLNHRAAHASEIPAAARPPRWLGAWSWAGIVFLAAFALVFLWVRFMVA